MNISKKIIGFVLCVALLITAFTTASVTNTVNAEQTVVTLYGDANSDKDISIKDMLVIKKYIVKINVQIDLEAADTVYDGNIDVKDMLAIKKYIVKIIDHLGPNERPTTTVTTTTVTTTTVDEKYA